jgi:AraC-like DNA-binding protein
MIVPVDAATYLLQDQLARYLEENRDSRTRPDTELVGKAVRAIVVRTLQAATSQRRTVPAASSDVSPAAACGAGSAAPSGGRLPEARDREAAAAEAFRRHLARHPPGEASPPRAIEETGASKTHVNRVLRAHLGWSPHRYGLELRLRRALVRWGSLHPDPAETLADLARELGFSSHSHLTARFREVFGVVPSWLREGVVEERLRWLSDRLVQARA